MTLSNDEKIQEMAMKYKKILSQNLESDKREDDSNRVKNNHIDDEKIDPIRSVEFQDFKNEYLPKHLSIYETLCSMSEKALKLKPDKKKEEKLQKAIDICHLNVTPTGVVSFSILGPLIFIVLGSFLGYVISYLLNPEAGGSFFFVFFTFIVGGSLILPLANIPEFLANQWRLKASNQMVLSVFYVVTYMRHTSNLELAIEFASDHLSPPLSVDLRKVLWNVEAGKFDSIKESLDDYLQTWKEWNIEYIDSMHLIESSLYEGSEERRIGALDKSLNLILDETYEKMLHYAHNLKGPITMLHMLGVILPILGLVILPLAVSFLKGIEWYHIATLYNIALPIMVYYLGKVILSKRPTGYGDSDVSENNPGLKKYKYITYKFFGVEAKISPTYIAIFLFMTLLFIGLIPIILHMVLPANFDISIGNQKLLDYTDKDGTLIGPYGLGATILSLFVTMAFGIGLGIYFNLKSKNIIKIRQETKKLEDEFATALFQLGNRLADGIPLEIAIQKVAISMEGTSSGEFFKEVSMKVTKLGISVERAIFDPNIGVLLSYPSPIIESSMKVLAQSSKKGPKVASNALINISRYIKEIHRVNERLNDLMADIISSMKSQIAFLTPIISGIVVGITAMITLILNKLVLSFSTMNQSGSFGNQGISGSGIMGMFSSGIPTYYFQIVVGIYVVQIVFILTILLNGIENGADKLMEDYLIGKNLIRSTLLYCFFAFIITMLFTMIAGTIMGSLVT